MGKVIVVDSLMGSGKSTWFRNTIARDYSNNFLYIAYKLDDIAEQHRKITESGIVRDICEPENKGEGKLGNIVNLLNQQRDIMSTHELFRRFDDRCYNALQDNKYVLVIDEAIEAVKRFDFSGKDDYRYLLKNNDITVSEDGQISWTGSRELNTRFDDVRILAENDCLFTVDGKFYLWHYPHKFFDVFETVYVLTYNFSGTLLKYYFDLYGIEYELRSIQNGKLVDYIEHPDKEGIRDRINVYQDTALLANISQKHNVLSANWCKQSYNKETLQQLQRNLYNYTRNIINAKGDDIMWTCYEPQRKLLKGKGYAAGWIPFNRKGSNEFMERSCLMYAVNYYLNPEIVKFFGARGVTINEDQVSLTEMLQWIWRSNIRVPDSSKQINIYIPSSRMRGLFIDWLAA